MVSVLFLAAVVVGLLGSAVVGVALSRRSREVSSEQGQFDLTFWLALLYLLLAMVGYGLGAILFLPLLVIAGFHAWRAISRWRAGSRPRPLTIAGIGLTALCVVLIVLVLADIIINITGNRFPG